MERIHIVGSGPRTGTTLLMEMMCGCFDIDLYPQHEASVYERPPRRGRIFLTKSPAQVAIAEPALCAMPNLHVIYIVRDPRDMIVSRHALAPDRYWVGLNFWKCLAPYGRRLQVHPRFITLRYEELVKDPNAVQRILMERIPYLSSKFDFSRYSQLARPSKSALAALGGVRPISQSSIGRWREHLPRITGQLAQHGPISDDLIEHGYETDNLWEQLLQDIVPDFRGSHWPDEWGIDQILPHPNLHRLEQRE